MAQIPVEDLEQLEGVMLEAYQAELARQLNDPARLEAMYGSHFVDADFVHKLEGITTSAAQLLGTEYAAISMVGADSVEYLATYGKPDFNHPVQESYCQHVVGTRRMLAVDNSTKHSLLCNHVATTEGGTRSYLGVPLVMNSKVIGVLCVWDRKPHRWTPAEVVMLSNLAAVLVRIEQVA